MIVSLSDILKTAEAEQIAVGAFNTPNLESLFAIIKGAEELNKPVIIMHAQVHEEMGLCKLFDMAPLMVFMADRASVPVCVHLDHGTDLGYLNRALELGFSSVMYDGSELTLEQNLANTAIAVKMASRYGASVEAEIGSMGAREAGEGGGESIYTDPQTAKTFVEKTGVDALACAFGTAHGIYLETPKLDFERLEKIHELIDVPIVMHGGSGVSREDYLKVIERGVRKINYYTYMAKAGGTAVQNLPDKTFFHDIAVCAEKAMREDVKNAIKTFSKL
ncbi:MAG: class II fructose-bisphosphate aldolase [Clostridiales bacterium]|nr:class II fructose-bisphosphate aldolase [Clostridiales bacterium]